MAVSANQLTTHKLSNQTQRYPVAASTTIYDGTLVFGTAAGYADDDTATGANAFVGVACEYVDNSGGSAGDKTVLVRTNGRFLLNGSSLAQANVNDVFYASDNYTVTGTSTNNSKIGRCKEYVSSTQVWVEIDTVQA